MSLQQSSGVVPNDNHDDVNGTCGPRQLPSPEPAWVRRTGDNHCGRTLCLSLAAEQQPMLERQLSLSGGETDPAAGREVGKAISLYWT